MDSNRRYSDEENPNPNPRHLQENQRIGREKARQQGDRNWNEQYNSGQSYHNRNEGYGPDQTHYGSQPNSAYRDQNRINYGDNRSNQDDRYNQDNRFNPNRYDNNRSQNNNWQQSSNQRPPQNREYDQNPPYRGQSDHNRRDRNNRDFDNPPQGDHGGTYFWGEREKYKDDDYRYRSGNRSGWHAGESLENDRDDRNRHNYNDRDQEGGFFNRIGDSISNTWNNLTNSDDDDNRDNNRNRYSQNRNFTRGSERGPRWADESENDDYEQRRRNNRQNRDWD